MNQIEKEINLLESKRKYLEKAWEDFHRKFFVENTELDPDYNETGVSNSGLTCWIIQHSLKDNCIVESDYWFILKAIQEQMRRQSID